MTTPTLREAAQTILDALAFRDAAVFSGDRDKVKFGADKVYEAADDLRAALTQAADAGAAEPVGWLYTLHMEFGQTQVKFSTDRFDLAVTTPWGRPGRDYSEEYPVTESPAHTAQQLQQAVARALAEQREQIAQGWDGCMYDAVGETIDIGAAIRQQGTP